MDGGLEAEMQAQRQTKKSLADAKKKYGVKEEAEGLDELSKKTLGSYVKKSANDMAMKHADVDTARNDYQAASAIDYSTSKTPSSVRDKAKDIIRKDARDREDTAFTGVGKRYRGIETAVKKLTKEDIISKVIDTYVSEDCTPASLDEQFIARVEHLPEAHAVTLLSLFDSLNEENKNRMLQAVDTEQGINDLLDFAIQNRGV